MANKLEKKEIFKIVMIAVAALALLFACYKVFDSEDAGNTAYSYTSEELRLVNLLSDIEGVGKVSVAIHTQEEETCVVIVCDGADNMLVRADILRAAALATGASTSNILIYKMSE